MATYRDLSGNGLGVVVEPKISSILPAGADVVVPAKTTVMRSKGAGNIVFRPAGGSADITLTVVDGEKTQIDPGSIIRNTGTTVTALHAMQERTGS